MSRLLEFGLIFLKRSIDGFVILLTGRSIDEKTFTLFDRHLIVDLRERRRKRGAAIGRSILKTGNMYLRFCDGEPRFGVDDAEGLTLGFIHDLWRDVRACSFIVIDCILLHGDYRFWLSPALQAWPDGLLGALADGCWLTIGS